MYEELLKFVKIDQYKEIIKQYCHFIFFFLPLLRIDIVSKGIIIETNKIEENKNKIYHENNQSKSISSSLQNKQNEFELIETQKEKIKKNLEQKIDEVDATQQILNSKISIQEKSKNQIVEMNSEIELIQNDIKSNEEIFNKINEEIEDSLESTLQNKFEFLKTMKDEDEGFTKELQKLSEENDSFGKKESKLIQELSDIDERLSEIEDIPMIESNEFESLQDQIEIKIQNLKDLKLQHSKVRISNKIN